MKVFVAIAGAALLAACGPAPDRSSAAQPQIKVRNAAQDQLHKFDALNLAIGLKRAIYDGGYTCKTVTDAGFVGEYENLDVWMARCSDGRDWAIFAGADGSAQVRDCKDLPGTAVPECRITRRPEGTFAPAGKKS